MGGGFEENIRYIYPSKISNCEDEERIKFPYTQGKLRTEGTSVSMRHIDSENSNLDMMS